MAKVLILISFFFLSVISNFNLVSSIPLTQDNFDKEVMQSKDKWIVMFMVPKCGAVKAFNPEWEKAAKNCEGKVKFGEVDCQENQQFLTRFKVQSFPTIIAFGVDKQKSAFVYQGERTAAAVEEAALSDFEKASA